MTRNRSRQATAEWRAPAAPPEATPFHRPASRAGLATSAPPPLKREPDVSESIRFKVRGKRVRIHYEIYRAKSGAPSAPHVLLLHGHSSSTRELDDVVPHLTDCNVYLFDQPNCGSSSDVDWEDVEQLYAGRTQTPILDFLTGVAGNFVRRVIERPGLLVPGVGLRISGGSLGGNLSLLLAERLPRLKWLSDIVVWSPGSGWNGNIFQTIAAGPALARAKKSWNEPRAKHEFLRATFCENVALDQIIPGIRPQPWYWYWDRWGGGAIEHFPDLRIAGQPLCTAANYPPMSKTKADMIGECLKSLTRAYKPVRARWHWRVAYEQVIFSQHSTIDQLGSDALFVAGEHDNAPPVDLHGYTYALYEKAKAIHGTTLTISFKTIRGSGHSIHNEKPLELAELLRRPTHVRS